MRAPHPGRSRAGPARLAMIGANVHGPQHCSGGYLLSSAYEIEMEEAGHFIKAAYMNRVVSISAGANSLDTSMAHPSMLSKTISPAGRGCISPASRPIAALPRWAFASPMRQVVCHRRDESFGAAALLRSPGNWPRPTPPMPSAPTPRWRSSTTCATGSAPSPRSSGRSWWHAPVLNRAHVSQSCAQGLTAG